MVTLIIAALIVGFISIILKGFSGKVREAKMMKGANEAFLTPIIELESMGFTVIGKDPAIIATIEKGRRSKSQKGAYKVLANAKKCADQNPGYKVFDADGKVVYEPKAAEPAVKVPFLVRVKISDLNIRKGPGTNYDRVQFCPPGVYTVVATSKGDGASLWGKLKSGIGWLSLDYVFRGSKKHGRWRLISLPAIIFLPSGFKAAGVL